MFHKSAIQNADGALYNVLRAETLSAPLYDLPETATKKGTRHHGLHRLNGLAHRNSRQLINLLPTEILTEIMFTVRDTEEDWPRILQVCRHWFVVGATTPLLWTCIRIGDSLNLLKTCLERSKTVENLELVITDLDMASDAFSELDQHTHRLRHLSLEDVRWEDAESLSMVLNTPFPRLESLVIEFVRPTGYRRELELEFFAEYLPRLCALSLVRAFIDPSSSILAQLQTLRLSTIVDNPQFSVGDLAAILRKCVNLEKLYIEDVHLTYWLGLAVGQRDKVFFPNLNTLQITNDFGMVTRILPYLVIPPSTDVRIQRIFPNRFGAMHDVPGVLPADMVGNLQPVLEQVTNVDVNLIHDDYVLFGCGPTPDHGSLLLSQQHSAHTALWPNACPGMDDLITVFGISPVERLAVDVNAGKMHGTVDWCAVFKALPELRELVIFIVPGGDGMEEHEHVYAHAVFNALGARRAPPQMTDFPLDVDDTREDVKTVLCPKLRSMKIGGFLAHTGDGFLTEIAGCLEDRKVILEQDCALDRLKLDPFWLGMREENESMKNEFEKTLHSIVEKIVYKIDSSRETVAV